MLPLRTLALTIGIAAPLVAGGVARAGDGSGSANPDLLRPSYACDTLCASQGIPDEGYARFFDVEWRLGLRGAYQTDTDGERFEAIALPGFTALHQGRRARVEFTGDAEIVEASDADLRLASARLGGRFDYLLDSLTAIRFGGEIGVGRDNAHAPGQPSTLLIAPQVLSGGIDAELTRRFGRFDVAARGKVRRLDYGPTTNVDLSLTDNTEQNYTAYSAGLRLGHEITPIVSGFVDGSVERDVFDIVSPTLLVKPDANTYALRGGLSATWNTRFEAEASIGVGYRDFDDSGLSDVTATLYDAKLTWRPTEVTELRASFATTLAPPGPNASGTTRVEYAAALDMTHRINRWLALRAGIDWRQAELSGSTETESGYGVTLGADYLLSRHTTLSADYRFAHAELTPNPPLESHRVTLGVLLKR